MLLCFFTPEMVLGVDETHLMIMFSLQKRSLEPRKLTHPSYQGGAKVEDRVDPLPPVVISIPWEPASRHGRDGCQSSLSLWQRTLPAEKVFLFENNAVVMI